MAPLSARLQHTGPPVIRVFSDIERPVAVFDLLWVDFASGTAIIDHLFRTQTRGMSDEENKMSLEIWCDLLEAELKRALEDVSVIRGLGKALAKSKGQMLRAALNNAQHYFREIQDSLR